VGAGLVTRSISIKTRRLRILRLSVFVGVIVLIVHAIAAIDLRFNFTPSMPLGIYRLTPLSKSGVERGSFVAVCVPGVAAELGRRRGYLAAGPCPTGAEPLLKAVAAVAGDSVTVSTNGVAVNGCLLPHSRALSDDNAGRRLSPWPHVHFQIRRSELWLYAANDRSWDSRYWGPGSVAEIAAQAIPLLTGPSSSTISGAELRRCSIMVCATKTNDISAALFAPSTYVLPTCSFHRRY
jgi:conjugative transfer signal peptidase TraF